MLSATTRQQLACCVLLSQYYCTGHGLGHATRAIEVCKHLVDRGHSVTVVTGAPARVFIEQIPPERFVFRKATLDSGSKQVRQALHMRQRNACPVIPCMLSMQCRSNGKCFQGMLQLYVMRC